MSVRVNTERRIPVRELSPGAVNVQPLEISWIGLERARDFDWSIVTTEKFEISDGVTTVSGHVAIDRWGEPYAVRDVNGRVVDFDQSESAVGVTVDAYLEGSATSPQKGDLTQGHLDGITGLEWRADSPMMNFWYPLESIDGVDDAVTAAFAIRHLPLVVVRVETDMSIRWGLALAGGGMDFSWEISEAFTALGFMPPVHFRDLPNNAGVTAKAATAYVAAAMQMSCRTVRERMERDGERLGDLYQTEALLRRGA